jgi:hypothetical protein
MTSPTDHHEGRSSRGCVDAVASDPPDNAIQVVLTLQPDTRRDLHDAAAALRLTSAELAIQLVQSALRRLLPKIAGELPPGRPTAAHP